MDFHGARYLRLPGRHIHGHPIIDATLETPALRPDSNILSHWAEAAVSIGRESSAEWPQFRFSANIQE
jgi:hypothetical protein